MCLDRLLSLSRRKMANRYARERAVAMAAVQKASFVGRAVAAKLVRQETVTKSDSSPVTGLSLPLACGFLRFGREFLDGARL